MAISENANTFYLYTLLFQTHHAIYQVRERDLRKYGLTSIRVAIMMVVKILGKKATPTEISRWLFRKPNAISMLLNKMEKEGLIKKSHDLEKKKMVRAELTPRGKKLYMKTIKRESLLRIMSALNQHEKKQLQEYLEKIWDYSLQELGKKERPPFPSLKNVILSEDFVD